METLIFSGPGFSKHAIMFYDHTVGYMNGIVFDLRCLLPVSGTRSSALKCVESLHLIPSGPINSKVPASHTISFGVKEHLTKVVFRNVYVVTRLSIVKQHIFED